MEGLLEREERHQGEQHADASDYERAPFEPHTAAGELEQHRDRHHHPPDQVRHGRGDRRPQVRAELLRRDGHEDGPVPP